VFFTFVQSSQMHVQEFKELKVFEQRLWIVYNEESAEVRPSIEKMAKHLQKVILADR